MPFSLQMNKILETQVATLRVAHTFKNLQWFQLARVFSFFSIKLAYIETVAQDISFWIVTLEPSEAGTNLLCIPYTAEKI